MKGDGWNPLPCDCLGPISATQYGSATGLTLCVWRQSSGLRGECGRGVAAAVGSALRQAEKAGGKSDFEKTRVLRLGASLEGRLGSHLAGDNFATSCEVARLREDCVRLGCDLSKTSRRDRVLRRGALERSLGELGVLTFALGVLCKRRCACA